jgi:hypothetical protein
VSGDGFCLGIAQRFGSNCLSMLPMSSIDDDDSRHFRGIHERLVEDVRGGVAAPGEYRKIRNYVVNSVPGEAVKIAVLWQVPCPSAGAYGAGN